MRAAPKRTPRSQQESLTDKTYRWLKQDIFDFKLLPGQHFTETEISERVAASRTPVREALYRLQRDGFVNVRFRNGWQVKPLDFKTFDQLYEVRIILEQAAVDKLCAMEAQPVLEDLQRIWLVPVQERIQDGPMVCGLDERFHELLVEATGNKEMARMHHEVTERLRVVRRLDFSRKDRITATYEEHGKIIHQLIRRRAQEARHLLKSHIECSAIAVRQITLQMLRDAQVEG